MRMEIQEVTEAVGGVWLNPREDAGAATSVSIDSREIQPGGLFLPLPGSKADGHRFIDSALDAGAAGCLCVTPPETLRPDKCYIQVPDIRRALGALAARWRARFSIPVIQITGSVGKTTTKDFVSSVLGTKLHVLKTPGNHNNDIGTPLTLLELDENHQAAVIETGMNHFGEIDYLGSLVQPTIAVITTIGDAHIEFLGSREGILKAKCEIFNHLSPDGLAILNGDNPLLADLKPNFRTVWFGYDPKCGAHVTDFIDHSVEGITCTITTERDSYPLEIHAPGGHMIQPAAIAAVIGEELGLNRDEIVRGAAAYRPYGSRMRVVRCGEGRILLDDCYNASPQSVAAALEILARTECGKRIAVLGDMGELGEFTEQAHDNAGALTAMLGIDYVIAIGQKARAIADSASLNGGDAVWYATKEEAMEEIKRQWEPESAVLVKASHAMGFETIVSTLVDTFGQADA